MTKETLRFKLGDEELFIRRCSSISRADILAQIAKEIDKKEDNLRYIPLYFRLLFYDEGEEE